jgi:transposase-like protein
MTYPPYVREKAEQLRSEKQLTVGEIAERLGIAKSTIFLWVGDIEIPRKPGSSAGLTPSAREKGNAAMRAKYGKLREAAYACGEAEFPSMARRPFFRDFVCLYIAEGSKRSRNRVAICNSDPAVLRVAHPWMKSICARALEYSIQYHADQDLAAICDYWAGQLGIDPDAIRLQRKSNSGKLGGRSWRSVNGVLTITGNDTYARARLQAWMDCVRSCWLDS